jgi:hypothetical protein
MTTYYICISRHGITSQTAKGGRVATELVLAVRLVDAEEIDVGLTATVVNTVSVTTTINVSTARR